MDWYEFEMKYKILDLYGIPEGYGYNHIFDNQVQSKKDGVPGEVVQWMVENCEGKWGWHFNDKGAVMSFKNETDLVLFSLVHGTL